jgi:transcriptional regulator with XRE-family HTH domain
MMRSTLAQAIRTARVASGLTQEQLGKRLGLKGRAVYRWERDANAPRKRHRRELVTAINAVNQAAATTLATVFASEGKSRRGTAFGAPAPAPVPTAPVIDPKLTLELAVFAMADDLDVPARRLRGGLIRLVKRMREASITLDAVQRHLEEQLE